MNRIGFLLTLILIVSSLAAQVPTPATTSRIIDSVGTATKHWSTIDFETVAVRTIFFTNQSATASLLIVLRGEDTVSTATRYRKTISSQQSGTVTTTQRYVFVRASDTLTTVSYSVSNVVVVSSISRDDSLEATLDRIGAQLPASKPRFVNDSLITTNATHTAYAAGDAISDSTSSPDIRLFTGAFLAANTPAKAEWLTVRTDTNVTVTLTFAFYDTVVAVNNDNAAYQTLAASSLRFLGEVTIELRAGGTGSTASQGTTYIGDIVRSPGTTNLYYRVKTLTAVTLKHKGRLDSTIKISYY